QIGRCQSRTGYFDGFSVCERNGALWSWEGGGVVHVRRSGRSAAGEVAREDCGLCRDGRRFSERFQCAGDSASRWIASSRKAGGEVGQAFSPVPDRPGGLSYL